MKPEEMFTLTQGDMLHYTGPNSRKSANPCTRTVGPRGGVKESVIQVKVTSVKTWKRRPDAIEVRFKFGLREFGTIGPDNAEHFHKAGDCPLNDGTWIAAPVHWNESGQYTNE